MKISLVSRFDDYTGIGWQGWSFLQALVATPDLELEAVYTGNEIPPTVQAALSVYPISISNLKTYNASADIVVFCDVITQIPQHLLATTQALRMAYVPFDSNIIARELYDLCVSFIDLLLVPDIFVKEAFLRAGYQKDLYVLPLVQRKIAFMPNKNAGPIRFLFIGSYEDRKNVEILLASLPDEFRTGKASLHLHLTYSHLPNEQLDRLIVKHSSETVSFSKNQLSASQYLSMLDSSDCFITLSGGEGYSLVPREYMQLGRPIILMDTSAHRSIPTMPGLYFLNPSLSFPARYPMFNGNYYGYFDAPYHEEVSLLLKQVIINFDRSRVYQELIDYSALFDSQQLAHKYRDVMFLEEAANPNRDSLHYGEFSSQRISEDLQKKYEKIFPSKKIAKNSTEVKRKKQIVLANDGGFFSIFNRLISILVHETSAAQEAIVIPDWRVSAMIDHFKTDKFTSFCYGNLEDGNVFLKLFFPLDLGIPESHYNDAQFLRDQAVLRLDYNEEKEPDLTYVHAYKLYKRKDFSQWRHWYHQFFAKHIKLRDDIQNEIDRFSRDHFDDYYVISAHVRHPSHSIEQPGGRIPTLELYKQHLDRLILAAEEKQSLPVRIFIATDQDSVIAYFAQSYGQRVVFYQATRVTLEQSKAFDALDEQAKKQEGFQIQHLMASERSRWSIQHARDVIIDAWLLAKAKQFVHVTSNLSTAVSYINPHVDMIYCE
jgi:hypothetical protein